MEKIKEPPKSEKKARPRRTNAKASKTKAQTETHKVSQNKSIFQILHEERVKLICKSKNINLILNTPKRDFNRLKNFVMKFNEYLSIILILCQSHNIKKP